MASFFDSISYTPYTSSFALSDDGNFIISGSSEVNTGFRIQHRAFHRTLSNTGNNSIVRIPIRFSTSPPPNVGPNTVILKAGFVGQTDTDDHLGNKVHFLTWRIQFITRLTSFQNIILSSTPNFYTPDISSYGDLIDESTLYYQYSEQSTIPLSLRIFTLVPKIVVKGTYLLM